MSNAPQWVDGPPVPSRCLHVQSDSPTKIFRLRWPGFGQSNDPEVVVDRAVFEAAVYALITGQETEGTAILESLGYKVHPLVRSSDRRPLA